MAEPIRTEVDERGVATLVTQRPQVRNAFDRELIAALHAAVDEEGRAGMTASVEGRRGPWHPEARS